MILVINPRFKQEWLQYKTVKSSNGEIEIQYQEQRGSWAPGVRNMKKTYQT